MTLLDVREFGANGSGGNADAAFASALYAARHSNASYHSAYQNMGLTIYFPAGVYRFSQAHEIENIFGLRLVGDGPGATIIVYDGPVNNNLNLWSIDGRECVVHGMLFRNDSGGLINSYIRLWSNIPGGWVTSGCWVSWCHFHPYTPGGAHRYCVTVERGAVGDQNNDIHNFSNNYFTGYTEAGVRIWGGQAHALLFERSGFAASRVGKYGIHAEYGGYLYVEGGTGGYHTEADFYVQNFITICKFSKWNSEGSARFLVLGQGGASASPTVVDSCRIDHAANLHADGRSIIFSNGGPLHVTGSIFLSTTGIPRIDMHGYVDTRNITIDGCHWRGNADIPNHDVELGGGVSARGPIQSTGLGLVRVGPGVNYMSSYANQAPRNMAIPAHVGLRGPTGASVSSANHNGRQIFVATEQTKSVSLNANVDPATRWAEPDANYYVHTSIHAYSGTPEHHTVQVRNRTTTGFDLVLDSPVVSGSIEVYWELARL